MEKCPLGYWSQSLAEDTIRVVQKDAVIYRSPGLFDVLFVMGYAAIGVMILVGTSGDGVFWVALFFFVGAAVLTITLFTGPQRISVGAVNGDVVLVVHRIIGRDELLPLRDISAIDYYEDNETRWFKIESNGRELLGFGAGRKECRLMLILLELNPAITATRAAQRKLGVVRASWER
jgi:hypothetical protein